MSKTALILGSSGRFARAMSDALSADGWTLRRFNRATDDLMISAQGADIIVNGWNPAYQDWAAQVPELHRQVQMAARASGATVLLPGNVYVFGQHTPAPWSNDTPHAAKNPLGKIRIAMEASYQNAGVQTILLRAGDFLDTRASGNWFDRVMASKIRKGQLTYPGDPHVPHAWAYLPDFAEAFVQLANKRQVLPVFTDVPFPGYTLTGEEMAQHLSALIERPVRLKPMPWWAFRPLQPFVPMFRHLFEMRYLWNTPHWLDDATFQHHCSNVAQTPVDQALRAAIQPL